MASDEKQINDILAKKCYDSLTFVRQYRFLFGSEHLTTTFNHAVKIKWDEKIIQFLAYEVLDAGKILIHEWVKNMQEGLYPDEAVTFSTLDACGNEIYRKKFRQLKIKNTESNFDYGKSDVVLLQINVSYENVTDEIPQRNTEICLDKVYLHSQFGVV